MFSFRSPQARLILKGLILAFALFGVIQAAMILRSPSFQATLGRAFSFDLGGGGKAWTWCPAGVEAVMMLRPQVQDLPAPFSTWCDVSMGSVTADEVKAAQFAPAIRAVSSSGEEVTLESDPSSQIFRAGGLPFKASALTKALDDQTRP